MSKRKAVIILLLIAITFFHGKNLVNAEEIFFTNKNGVSMTEKEYNFFREMYNDNYPKIIPQDVYDIFKNGNYFDGNIRVNTYTEDTNPNTRGTFHSTANKSIRIAASCTTTCAIAVSAKWINNPTIRSYDVIGAYLYNVSTIGSISTQAASNTKNVFATSTKRQTNGHGASILLPSGSNILSLQCASLPCIHGFNPPHSLITFSGGIFSFAPEKYFISLGFAEKIPSTKL